MFVHKKQACGELCFKAHKHTSANSALWIHSKEAHDGKLTVEDWRISITSSHRGALNRQVTEAVSISNEGVSNLLNSKMEFGANNLTELTIKKGNDVVGAFKRRRKEEEEQQKQEPEQQAGQEQQSRQVKKLVRSTVQRDVRKETLTGATGGIGGEEPKEEGGNGKKEEDGGEESIIASLKKLKLGDLRECQEYVRIGVQRAPEMGHEEPKDEDDIKAGGGGGEEGKKRKRSGKVKGIDEMGVEELKEQMKKRKMKGFSKLKLEGLRRKLKEEVKSQMTIKLVKMKKKPEEKKEKIAERREGAMGNVKSNGEEKGGVGEERRVEWERREGLEEEGRLRHLDLEEIAPTKKVFGGGFMVGTEEKLASTDSLGREEEAGMEGGEDPAWGSNESREVLEAEEICGSRGDQAMVTPSSEWG